MFVQMLTAQEFATWLTFLCWFKQPGASKEKWLLPSKYQKRATRGVSNNLLKRLFKGYLNWGKITDTSYKSVQTLWKVKRKQRASFTCCSIVHRCGKYDQMLLSFCPWESSGLYRRNIPSHNRPWPSYMEGAVYKELQHQRERVGSLAC